MTLLQIQVGPEPPTILKVQLSDHCVVQGREQGCPCMQVGQQMVRPERKQLLRGYLDLGEGLRYYFLDVSYGGRVIGRVPHH